MLVGVSSPQSQSQIPPNIYTHITYSIIKFIILGERRLRIIAKMKIFSWIRSRRNANEANTTSNRPSKSYDHIMHESCKEEFSDWPNSLLAIGTFGNPKHSEKAAAGECQDPPEKTSAQDLEEVGRELRLMLNNEKEILSVEQLLDCLCSGDGAATAAHPDRKSSVAKRGRTDSRNRDIINKKSLSFLIKKTLLCGGGLAGAPPVLRDPNPDPKSDLSMMEKILRAMLHKKIYPQRPIPNKCLDMAESESGDEEESEEEGNRSCKWVKTDSEYIVLEI